MTSPEELERALRASLARRVADPPPGGDPAGRAIHRGRRLRRRRSVTSGVLAAAVTAAIAVGGTQFGAPTRLAGPAFVVDPAPPAIWPAPTGTPDADLTALPRVPPPAGGRLPVDIVVSGQLWTADGGTVDLTGVGPVLAAYRTAGGWLLVDEPAAGKRQLWYATVDEPPQVVVGAADALVIAADGRRIAWRDGARLLAATVDDGRTVDARQVTAPDRAVPTGFAGPAVLMGRQGAGGRVDAYDLWSPRRAAEYEPAWRTGLRSVYPATPDGSTLLGLVAGPAGRSVLVELDPADRLVARRTSAALPLAADGPGAVSPDGRWLIATGPDGGGRLVDLDTVFTPRPRLWPAGPAPDPIGAWTDGARYTGTPGLGLVRVDPTQPVPGAAVMPVRGLDPAETVLVVAG